MSTGPSELENALNGLPAESIEQVESDARAMLRSLYNRSDYQLSDVKFNYAASSGELTVSLTEVWLRRVDVEVDPPGMLYDVRSTLAMNAPLLYRPNGLNAAMTRVREAYEPKWTVRRELTGSGSERRLRLSITPAATPTETPRGHQEPVPQVSISGNPTAFPTDTIRAALAGSGLQNGKPYVQGQLSPQGAVEKLYRDSGYESPVVTVTALDSPKVTVDISEYTVFIQRNPPGLVTPVLKSLTGQLAKPDQLARDTNLLQDAGFVADLSRDSDRHRIILSVSKANSGKVNP